jgi:hypothetical protein
MFGSFPALRNQLVHSIGARLYITPDLPPRLFDPLSPRRDAYGILFRLENNFVSGLDAKYPAHLGRNDNSAIFSDSDMNLLFGHDRPLVSILLSLPDCEEMEFQSLSQSG